MTNADGSACRNCGRLVHTGEGKVAVEFTPDELAKLIRDTTDPDVHARLICALGLIDAERADRARDGVW